MYLGLFVTLEHCLKTHVKNILLRRLLWETSGAVSQLTPSMFVTRSHHWKELRDPLNPQKQITKHPPSRKLDRSEPSCHTEQCPDHLFIPRGPTKEKNTGEWGTFPNPMSRAKTQRTQKKTEEKKKKKHIKTHHQSPIQSPPIITILKLHIFQGTRQDPRCNPILWRSGPKS